jgi:hypothetical protein
VRKTVHSALHRAIFATSRVADDSAAIHRFNMTAGGAYFAVGRGAAITGRGAHLQLIDDQLKDAEEANSATSGAPCDSGSQRSRSIFKILKLISKRLVDKPPAIWSICFIALLP